MSYVSKRRWGDNDKNFGPFTYAKDTFYKSWAVVLNSGDNDEHLGCNLRFSGFGRTFIINLPAIVKPYQEKVMAPSWDKATVERMGCDYYYNYDERRYGFSYCEGYLQIFKGRSTGDSSTDKTKGYFLPWTEWRHVRFSLYDLNGEHFWTETKQEKGKIDNFQARWDAEEKCPSMSFIFADFDGEVIEAKTKIEEREWRFGEGWFKWLSWFCKPKIKRSLDIRFSKETGKRKGSWKGGTTGHAIEMYPGELHELAFRRYCHKHDMQFDHTIK